MKDICEFDIWDIWIGSSWVKNNRTYACRKDDLPISQIDGHNIWCIIMKPIIVRIRYPIGIS